MLLWCVGRDGNTRDIGLDRIGITPNAYGLLEVNEHYQTLHPHVYAVGDVIGYPALASTAMEQGRRAIRHAFAVPGYAARTEVLPFAVYAIPEVSYVGETEEKLRERGVAYVAGRGNYDKNPRGQISGATGGLLKLLFEADSMRLVGVHIVGPNASELVHIGQAFIRAGATAVQIAETLYNYPTLSDMYRHAALKALAEHAVTDARERRTIREHDDCARGVGPNRAGSAARPTNGKWVDMEAGRASARADEQACGRLVRSGLDGPRACSCLVQGSRPCCPLILRGPTRRRR